MSPVRARLALVLGLGAGPALAAPPPGDYVLVEGHRSFDIEAWGPDCGPQPDAQRHGPGARYRLDAEGWLRAQGGAPPVFQPDICAAATGIPSMRGGRGGGGRVRCANPVKAQPVKGQARLLDGDPNALTVLERFEYDWVLKGTACKLTQHARWTLRRDPPLDRCRAPGPAARLSRVGAASQRGRSGQALQFRVQTEDAEGCPVAAEPTWQASLGRITDKGVLQLGAGDAGRSGTVTATLDGQSVVWSLTVAAAPAPQPGRVVSSAAEELVPDWDEDGALEVEADLGLAPQAGSAVTAEVTAPAPASGPSPLVVGLFIGLGLAALAIAVWIGLSARRLRRAGAAQGLLEAARRPAPPSLPRMSSSTPPPDGRAPSAPPGPGPADLDDGPMVCPSCGRHFDDGSRFCPHDGQPLEEATEAVAAAAQPKRCPRCGTHWPSSASHCAHDGAPLVIDDPADATTVMATVQAKTCPRCGTRYPAETEFCGLDGERLVLLN